jgi:periplasmic divalent cation tolerance protein
LANKTGVALIYVPCGSEDEAARLAKLLLAERLIACANIYESRSLFRWDGELADEREFVMVCKTTPQRAADAEQRIIELHSYEVPCVLRIEPAHANEPYAEWVAGEVADWVSPRPAPTE